MANWTILIEQDRRYAKIEGKIVPFDQNGFTVYAISTEPEITADLGSFPSLPEAESFAQATLPKLAGAQTFPEAKRLAFQGAPK